MIFNHAWSSSVATDFLGTDKFAEWLNKCFIPQAIPEKKEKKSDFEVWSVWELKRKGRWVEER